MKSIFPKKAAIASIAVFLMICAIRPLMAEDNSGKMPDELLSDDLQIVSPAPDTILAPGQEVLVKVRVTNSQRFKGISIVSEGIMTKLKASPPFEYHVVIPASPIGERKLTAIGILGPGQGVFSAPLRFYVESPEQPVRLTFQLSAIRFERAGEQYPLTVYADYPDGTTLRVSNSSIIQFRSSNEHVAIVDESRMVTATGAGSAEIVVTYGSRSLRIPVSVPDTIPGDLNGYGGVTKDDLNILYGGLGLTVLDDKDNIPESAKIPVEPYDARDLDHNGFLDKHDVEIMKRLIGNATLSPQTSCQPRVPRINESLFCRIEVFNSGPDVAKHAGISVFVELTGPGVAPILDNKKLLYSRIEVVASRSLIGNQSCSQIHRKPNTLRIGCFLGDILPGSKGVATFELKIKSPGKLHMAIEAETATPGADRSSSSQSEIVVNLGKGQSIPKSPHQSMEEVDIEALVQILRDAAEQKRSTTSASIQLRDMGPSAIPRLIILVREDPNPEVRKVAIQILGQMPEESGGVIVSILMSVFQRDPDESVRREAVRWLGGDRLKKEARSVVPDLIEFLQGDPSGRNKSVSDALIRIGPSSIKPMEDYLEKYPTAAVAPRAEEILAQLKRAYRVGQKDPPPDHSVRDTTPIAISRSGLFGKWHWIAVRQGNSIRHPEGGSARSPNETHYYFGPEQLIIECRSEFQLPRRQSEWDFVSFENIRDDVFTIGLRNRATLAVEEKTFKLVGQQKRLEIITPAIHRGDPVDIVRNVLMLNFIDKRQVPQNH